MKLVNLKVVKAFGYLPINVKFHEDLTFLVGPNGSGKTTALRLIQAILAPAFEELYAIPFERATLEIQEGDQHRQISVIRAKDAIRITVSGIPDSLILPEIDSEQVESLRPNVPRSEAVMELLRPNLLSSPVFDFLQKLSSPLFLGLDRRLVASEFDEDFDFSRARNYAMHRQDRRMLRGSLGGSLHDVQGLAQEAYRRFRRAQEAQTTRLRRATLLSAFRYTDMSDFERTLSMDPALLLGRKDEIVQALLNLGIGGAEVTKQIDEFFAHLERLFWRKGSGAGAFDIELLTNKAQIERVEELIRLIDEHRSASDTAYAPIKRFTDTMNSFFSDTRKGIDIDQVGALKVVRPDKVKVGIEALSSGERQLLVIFGHLFFNRFGAKSNVFIIDEPELSLHLRWQEMFVAKAVAANPSAQIILATHSPEILAGHKERATNLGVG